MYRVRDWAEVHRLLERDEPPHFHKEGKKECVSPSTAKPQEPTVHIFPRWRRVRR